MHSLVGCHLEWLAPYENQCEQGKVYQRFQIHLSQHTRRVLFFETKEEVDRWFRVLSAATQARDIAEHYDLDMSQERLIGEGSFGQVYIGYDKANGASVAIKVLQRRGMKSSDLEFNLNEVGILSVVGSDHVPYLLDVFENFNLIFIVQEFIEGISLN